MELLFDIGNSNIVLGIHKNGEIQTTLRLFTDRQKTSDEYAVVLNALMEDMLHEGKPSGAAIASVVPELTAPIAEAVEKMFGISPFIIKSGVKTGLNVPGSSPGAVGADFICGAVGAVAMDLLPAIVIDLGTATKFFVVTKEHTFLGGSILPGVQISLEALSSRTSQLPHIELMKNPPIISLQTVEAMSSGLIHGTAAMVDGMVARYKKEIGEATVLATGGLASLILPHCIEKIQYHPELILVGLAEIYQKNQ